MMTPIVIIQCRLNSSRLPGKAALDMHGAPLLARVIERCRLAGLASEVVVATSDQPEDEIVSAIAASAGAPVYRGSLDDVRARLLGCARAFGADVFIRATADNPFVEPDLIDALIALKRREPDCPYAVHDLAHTVYGTASELVDTAVLNDASGALPDAGREHVTTGLADLASARILTPPAEFADPLLSLTIDTLAQYRSAWSAMGAFGIGRDALPGIVRDFVAGAPSGIAYQKRG